MSAQLKVWEPVTFGGCEWLVLDVQPGKALLLSRDCVEKRPYHSTYTGITWADCTLRQYLNSEFYDKFTAAGRQQILTVSNGNPANPWYGTNGGSGTDDKIFLLSLDEAVGYFGDSTALAQLKNRPGSDRWIKNEHFNQEIISRLGNTPRLWWLRSPGIAGHAAGVNTVGIVSVCGSRVDNGFAGIRPAFWLKTES